MTRQWSKLKSMTPTVGNLDYSETMLADTELVPPDSIVAMIEFIPKNTNCKVIINNSEEIFIPKNISFAISNCDSYNIRSFKVCTPCNAIYLLGYREA